MDKNNESDTATPEEVKPIEEKQSEIIPFKHFY